MFRPSDITAKATAMIVAFMKPLLLVKKNGSTIPITIRVSASARAHQGGSRLLTASRHSPSCLISSLMGLLQSHSSRLPGFLAARAAGTQDHDHDQVSEDEEI